MIPELESAAQLVLGWLQQGGETVIQQAPVLAKELLQYHIINNGMSLAALALIGFLAWKMHLYCWAHREDDDGFMLAYIFLIPIGCFVSVMTVACTIDLLQAVFTPHFYILKTLLHLI